MKNLFSNEKTCIKWFSMICSNANAFICYKNESLIDQEWKKKQLRVLYIFLDDLP